MTVETLFITDFAKEGLNSDILPWDLPPSTLTDGLNFRIFGNSVQPFGGFTDLVQPPEEKGHILYVIGSNANWWLIAGNDRIDAFDSAVYTDIAPVGMITVDKYDWTSCMLSAVPIMNNSGYYPLYWPSQSPSIPMEILPWDDTNSWQDAGQSCEIIRSHKQYLFALKVQQAGQFVPDGVRWSTPADVNSVPASWDELDTTNVAGFVQLGGDGGPIVDGLSLRDSFIVYREKSINIFDYTPGSPFIWRIRSQTTSTGLVAKNALVEAEGIHYFIGDGDIMINDGRQVDSILHNRLRRKLVSLATPNAFPNSFAVKLPVRNEIWFCIPCDGDIRPNRAFIYNWRDQSWAIRNFAHINHAANGRESKETLSESWDNAVGQWDNFGGPWNAGGLSPLEEVMMSAFYLSTADIENGRGPRMMYLDRADLGNETGFYFYVERIGLSLNGLGSVTTITRIYPHIDGPGICEIQLGSQDFPNAPIRWKPAVKFDPTKDRKIDIRTTGEVHCYRVSAEVDNTTFSMSGMEIEYVAAGLR